jgi:NTE family protein
MLRTENEGLEPTMLARILRRHFTWSDAEIVDTVDSGAEYITLSSGQTLFRQGEVGDDIYFVLSGRLRATATGSDGRSKTLGEIGRGETIGELALFTGEARSATIVALRDARLARVSRPVIERAIAARPEVAASLTRLVVERFRHRESAKSRNAVPVTVCFLPVSPNIDATSFARTLSAQQPQKLGRIAILGAADITGGTGFSAASRQWLREDALVDRLDEIERQNAAVYLVADGEDTAWTRFCLKHADEVLLLADAATDPAPSAVEQTLLAGPTPVTIARRTLVLLHDAATRSPRGTVRWLASRERPRHVHVRPTFDADMARLARIISGRAVGLVFAGGGARGFAHIGIYQALEEAGIPIDFIGGTSIGALMGTLVALDVRAPEMRDGVRDGFLRHPKGNITGDFNLLPMLSLIKGDRSRESLATSVHRFAGGEIDMEDSWKTFFAIASDFSAGREEVLRDGPLTRNVAASFAIPGALPPILMDGHLLFDGSTFNNFPVDVMAAMGAGKVIGVDLSSDFGRRLDMDAMPSAFELLRDRLRPRSKQRYRRLPTMPETMMISSFITSLSRQEDQRRFADLVFRPSLPKMGLLDWHRFDEVVEAGRRHAAEVLASMSKDALAAYR